MITYRLLHVVSLMVLSLALAACGTQTPPSGAAATQQPPPAAAATQQPPAPAAVQLLGDDKAYPAGCSLREVSDLMSQFVTAYNAGDRGRFMSLIDPIANHGMREYWYGDNIFERTGGLPEIHFAALKTEELERHFAERQAQHDQIQLRTLVVQDTPWREGKGVDIGFVITRKADDLGGNTASVRIGDGKGVILCPERKVAVWTMNALAESEVRSRSFETCTAGSVTDMIASDITTICTVQYAQGQ